MTDPENEPQEEVAPASLDAWLDGHGEGYLGPGTLRKFGFGQATADGAEEVGRKAGPLAEIGRGTASGA